MPEVILLGDINVDMIATLPVYPARGAGGVVNTIATHTGGSVVSTAVALSAMGVQAGIVGRLGNDALSVQVLNDLDKANIDRTCIQIDTVVSTGLIYIIVNPDGERTMFSARGANVLTEPTPEMDTYFVNSRWYHFSGYTLLAEPQQSAARYGLDLAKQNRCAVSFDPGTEPALRYGKQIKELLAKTDIFFPNEQELIAVTGIMDFKEAIQDLLNTGLRALIVKTGRKGCILAYDKVYVEIPGFEIQVKDTTGAGDSFNSGVILGRMVGLGWVSSAILGNAMGALASAAYGTGPGDITPRKVIELIEADILKPHWEEMYSAVDSVLAYLSGL